jgi:glutamyl/glutaminyl-tRNA synthetase
MRAWLAQVIDLVKTHVDHLDQLPREAGIIFGFETEPPEIDENAREALGQPEGKAVAQEFTKMADEKESLTAESYREIVAQVKANTRQKGRSLFHPIRAALTGRGSGPEMEKLIPLYESGSRLNLPRKVMSCRERLHAVLDSLS